jgi:hypothetical protein
MNKDEIRQLLEDDIAFFREKAKFYESHRLVEAGNYADRLADNLELALTTMPSEDDPEIA